MSVGLLDTSVVIDWDDPSVAAALPEESSVCAITLAELAAGPHVALTSAEGCSSTGPFAANRGYVRASSVRRCRSRSYGQIVAAVAEAGRSHRRRVADLFIAATAHANGLALYTRNPDDFAGLEDLVPVIGL